MKLSKLLSIFILALFLCGCSSPQSTAESPTAQSTSSAVASKSTEATLDPCYPFNATQPSLIDCTSQKAQASYTQLKALLVELQSAKTMSASQYSDLLKLETDWERLAQDQCDWQAAFFQGGSIQPTWYSECLYQQYSQRIDALRLNLCQGNGATGECPESLKYKQVSP